MSAPKKLIVEYEDGTRRETAFGRLSNAGRTELSALGLCEAAAPDTGKKYLLLEWKDGWKEIEALDGQPSNYCATTPSREERRSAGSPWK